VTRRFDVPSPRAVNPTFIFWGRISNQKRLCRSICFFSKIYKRYPLAKFWILGPDGGELEASKKLCASLGLTEVVTFVGAVTQDEIITYASRASFFLQMSAYEGMSLSVVESMQLGLVPVVTPVGEIPNYCANGVNAVFVNSDKKALEEVSGLIDSGDFYQIMRANAIATWSSKILYRESVLIACQKLLLKKNLDSRTVASFGDEWSRFDQRAMPEHEAHKVFEEYFAIFSWNDLPKKAVGFDMGCGSGRWARWVAPKVGHLHCIDPSDAIYVAMANLDNYDNVTFHQTSVDSECLPLASQDFGYSLGVLHHVPDTAAAIRSCVNLLKPGAPLLLYLYYAFDNRSWWFRALWGCSDLGRRLICKLPPWLKHAVTNVIALLVYFPLATSSRILEKLGCDVGDIPLSYYRKHSFYTMRTDARDRFGTPLEHRFTREQIKKMMEGAGLTNICFSESAPFWCAVGVKC
jgi:SAM-dependent methyltransferase